MTAPLDDRQVDESEVLRIVRAHPGRPHGQGRARRRFQPLAEYFARRFAGRGEPIEDLNQVANIGLLSAIDRFDPTREVRFATYAAATILGELKRHLRDKAWAIRVPRPLQELGLRMNRVMPQLSQELGRSPTIQELAEQLEATPEDVLEAMDAAQAYSTASLDAPVGEGERSPIETVGGHDPSVRAGRAVVGDRSGDQGSSRAGTPRPVPPLLRGYDAIGDRGRHRRFADARVPDLVAHAGTPPRDGAGRYRPESDETRGEDGTSAEPPRVIRRAAT